MQEHVAKNVRITILLWLLALALFSPYLIRKYEQRPNYHEEKWEEIVQPHWEEVTSQADDNLAVDGDFPTDDPVSQDVVEWKNVDVSSNDVPPNEVAPAAGLPTVTAEEKIAAPTRKKISAAPVAIPKPHVLKLKVPENLYRGHLARWDEKKPATLPNFFAPKQEEPSRFQLGGHLIMDDETQKKTTPDTGYLDTIKGAEINISVKTQ